MDLFHLLYFLTAIENKISQYQLRIRFLDFRFEIGLDHAVGRWICSGFLHICNWVLQRLARICDMFLWKLTRKSWLLQASPRYILSYNVRNQMLNFQSFISYKTWSLLYLKLYMHKHDVNRFSANFSYVPLIMTFSCQTCALENV